MKYKLTENGVQNIETTAFIPNNERNKDWQEYQNWLKGLNAEGEDLGTGENMPVSQFTEEELEIIALREVEQITNEKINDEIRKIAINNLIAKKELPIDYK